MADGNGDFRLPDHPELAWILGQPSERVVRERKVIGTILAADDDLKVKALGCAFVVYAAGDRALCVCAAHSLDALRSLDRKQRRKFDHLPPNDGEFPEPDYVDPERLNVIFLDEDSSDFVQCRVADFHFQGGSDVAIFTAYVPEGRAFFDWRVAISFDVPRVGDVVSAVGYKISLDTEGRLEQSLEMRRGLVTAVEFDKTGAGQSFVYHTTFPSPAGLSGSPVFLDLKKGEDMVVVGIVSADLSPTQAYGDQRVAGRSTVSMLWPIGALAMKMSWGESGERLTTLFDLVASGAIPDATKRATVESKISRKRTTIVLRDPAHGTFELETGGHPRAEQ